ncbi:T9SS type A sorting domain-containing protein [Winogradskyella schleiferi]|uniref:T9SS type A sorting domain-containing protein n=1 Tax=Winogradskyella schleiferi TaxID=2686078 RepID=UPI0015BEC6E3|nr:T9SS type A sorting domain-containing protein [Winogradskyella schleiferi]
MATINPATRTYLEEPSLNTVTIPSGIEVHDWYFLITVEDQSRQSADLKGSDYGFGLATLSVTNYNETENIILTNRTITFINQGNYHVAVYDILGKQITNTTFNVTGTLTHDFQLQNSGIYLVKINDGLHTRTVKMLKY